jgi:Domain of unknown function (DUF4062)
MNRTIDDLIAERQAAGLAVQQFAPITTPWAFEEEPASSKQVEEFFLEGVKSCDLFVLILGKTVTAPVEQELTTAGDYGKPVLAFCKTTAELDLRATSLIRALPWKYDSFGDSAELREKLRQALGLELLRLIRGERSDLWRSGDRIARLRDLQRQGQRVRLAPMVPPTPLDVFSIQSVDARTIMFSKANGQDLGVPAQRIAEVLDANQTENPLVLISGRLQWMSLKELWQFFPEPPPSDDYLGVGYGKQHPAKDPAFDEEIRHTSYSTLFSNREQIATRKAEGWEVFFDHDGKHRDYGGQILMIKGRLRP